MSDGRDGMHRAQYGEGDPEFRARTETRCGCGCGQDMHGGERMSGAQALLALQRQRIDDDDDELAERGLIEIRHRHRS